MPEKYFLTSYGLKNQNMNVVYKKYHLIFIRPYISYAVPSWNCLICSCLLNNKILKDGEIKNVTVSKTYRFEVKLKILNSLLKIQTGFSDDNMLKNLIESKSVLESFFFFPLKDDVRNFICTMVSKIIEKYLMKYRLYLILLASIH